MTRQDGGQTGAGGGQNIPAIVGQEIIAGSEVPPPIVGQAPSQIDVQSELARILATITSVNDIRAQIIRLGLNPSLRFAVETEVVPVLNILTALATAADFYSVAAFNMSNINFAKSHEIRKTLELIYDITDLSEDVFEVVKKLTLATLPKAPY
ncbi:MAG TPA: hypothetical protein DD429_07145 [Clostridiaceae bacterium]|nr:hypothetical protein [Clostridiaceae bacterium]